MNIGDRIRKQRILSNLSQTELAEKIQVSKQTLYKYENNIITNVPSDKIESIASALNVTPAFLMGWDEKASSSNNKTTNGVKINVLGRVAAGIPISAVEDIIDTEEISEEMASTGEFFGLKIKGDSMEPRIYDGDVVIVRQQSDADSGDIVIALVNGDDATCKRLTKYAGGIGLISLNPKYEPMMFSDEDIQSKPVKIIGKVVELRGKL